MKILAIRGKNLASLSQDFVVDYQQEPLASAGLYAITGPTGSGKSTLLDALCLALYEKTPRLTGVGRSGDIPDVGDSGIAPGDVRTLLRRGAAEGYAEVDFEGSDGVAYRARWSVRRARGKADGKLQNSEVSLLRLADEQVLGEHRKTETLRLIETKIGLSFAQFTRAVLLAQNDFSAFLKANDDERAELLQTLTGTESYTALSIHAFERMKAEREALARLQERLQDQVPLASDVRAAKDTQHQSLQAEAQTLAAQKTELERQLRWHQVGAQLQEAQEQASAQLEAARAEQQTAAPRQAQLALVDRVQEARPWWTEQRRLQQVVTDTQAAAQVAQAARASCEAQLAAQQLESTASELALANAESARSAQQPALEAAKALDATLRAIEPQVELARTARQQAAAHAQTEQARLTGVEERQTSARSERALAQQWLLEQAPLRVLADGWQRWEMLFQRLEDVAAAKDGTDSVVAIAERAECDLQGRLARVSADKERVTQALATEQAQLQELSQQCLAIDVEQLAAQKATLEYEREAWQSATQLWTQHQERQQRSTQQAQVRQQYAELLASNERTLQEALGWQPLAESQLQTAEAALRLALLASGESAESMRAGLQADKPCPVCGALEHPYVAQTPAMDTVLTGLQDLVNAKRKSLRDVESRAVQARSGVDNARQLIAQVDLELEQLAAEQARVSAHWSEHALSRQLSVVPDAEKAAWLAERQEALRAALDAVQQQESVQRDLLKRKEAAQVQVNVSSAALTQAVATLTELESRRQINAHRLSSARQQQSEVADAFTALYGQLDGAFADTAWRAQWQQDSQAFVAECKSRVVAWNAQQERVDLLTNALVALQVELDAGTLACQHAQAQLQSQSAALETAEAELQSHRSSRAALLGGRDAPELEASLNAAMDLARQQQAQVQAALHAAQIALTRAAAAVEQHEQALVQNRVALATVQQQLDSWLAAFNAHTAASTAGQAQQNQQPDRDAYAPTPAAQDALTPAALDALLLRASGWVLAEREALQRLEQAVASAQAVLATRVQSCTDHAAQGAGIDPLESLQQALARLLLTLAGVTDALAALKLELARDDERLATSASLRDALTRQETVFALWARLSDLIGSADGKKFRNFAQQLTLDILLGYGNLHLQNLARRYRLQRIHDSLGLLVVDQDMGDELRSVHSLSGGESFLVSLALALGLASLSSHRVQVESLFIDEGFGSLDADALGVAMDALDNLQSLGRKVGVISHVQEMTERIGTRVQVQRQAGGVSRIVVR